jgi:hypothetical protein
MGDKGGKKDKEKSKKQSNEKQKHKERKSSINSRKKKFDRNCGKASGESKVLKDYLSQSL